MLVHQFLERAAAQNPSACALIEPRRTTGYGDLNRLVNRVAHLLVRSGVERGDRVIVAIENSVEFVAAYLGTMKAGAVAVPLPPGARSDRLAQAVGDCTPAAAIVDRPTAGDFGATHPLASVPAILVANRHPQAPLPAALHDLTTALSDCDESGDISEVSDTDLAAIIYTSGSTGSPRGVMLTHRNIVANTHSIIQYLALTDQDRVMCVLPFYYVYGLSLLHTHLAVGGSIVLDNRFMYPNVVLAAMQQQRVTGFAGVPSTFAMLLHKSDLTSIPIPSLRYATQAGGGMAAPLIAEWLERGWPAPFYVMYGATEASARLTYLPPDQLRAKMGSIGRPIPGVEVQVIRENGTVAKVGEVGELVAQGPNVSSGYWNCSEESAVKFGPLGLRTGDLGYRDADGFLFLVGRLNDIIKVGANRVGAKEIEDVLHAFPGVHEVAVVPAPHALLVEVPVAFLSAAPDAQFDVALVQAFCRSRLPAYKVPDRFVLLPDLPKLNAAGKINKRTLRDMARATAGGA
jgi:long-chain acyl-CoA synthetase